MNTCQIDAMSRLIAAVEPGATATIPTTPKVQIDAEQIDAYICAKADADRCNARLQDAAEVVGRLPRGVYVGTLGAIVVTEDYQNIHPRIWVETRVVVAAEFEGA